MIAQSDLCRVKRSIERSVGERVRLSSNKGKKKAFIREGIIESSYPSIFIVKFENEYETTRRLSFSYTDIVTKAVELVICKSNPQPAELSSTLNA